MKQQAIFQVDKVKLEVTNRVNFMPFSGVCLFADTISDGIPSGNVNKPVRFPMDELEKSIQTMKLMGVNCKYPKDLSGEKFSGHDSEHKIGVVESVELIGNEMHISGGLWDSDFEEECTMVKLAKDALGWSVEVFFRLEDRGEYYDAVNIDFTGVALMWKSGAAFKKTRCAAQEAKNINKGGNQMDEQKLQGMLEALYGKFEAKFNEMKSEVDKANAQVEQLAVAFAEEKAEAKAKVEAEEKAAKEQAELAAKKAEEEKLAKETEEKAKAELAEKQKKEAEELEVQRKSLSAGIMFGRFEGKDDKQKAILGDSKLSASEKFQRLIADQVK